MVDLRMIESWKKAPRLTSFAPFFERTASGLGGAPDLLQPVPNMSLFEFDLDCLVFWDTHRRLWGHFDSHYFASIPYRLEEECRLGTAILSFALRTWARSASPATVYTLGAGTGCLARTLAKFGDGRIIALSCSPTDANRTSFFAKRGSEYAHFFHGPFFELDDTRYAGDETLRPFQNGFTVLLEDTTFQMYDRDRRSQLEFIAPRVRTDGVLIQVQKLLHEDNEVYAQRERQKDELFKSRFFSETQISEKKHEVLNTMMDFQVDLESTMSALKSYFRYSVVTWNSGNFYTFVSSNSRDSLLDFLSLMVKPAIPPKFCYEKLPLASVETDGEPVLTWRSPNSMHRKPIGKSLA